MTVQNSAPAATSWPSLRVADWVATRDTLHMWIQIVGKIRQAHAPLVNKFLHTTYEAAAERGGWDRQALEDDPHRWRDHR